MVQDQNAHKRRAQLTLDPVISVVVPMHNEQDGLARLFDVLGAGLTDTGQSYEIICVNDGSRDQTLLGLMGYAARDARIKIINLSRNFGKEAALTAGLDAAQGQAIIPLDADLQEPPELIKKMVALWQDGYDVVLAKRIDRASDSWFKRVSAGLFYRLLKALSDVEIPENVGDFRLMDRQVNAALRRLPERTRFMKGLFAWLGFTQTTIEFTRPGRLEGEAKQDLRKLLNLATDGLVSFSGTPLRFWGYLGFATAGLAFAYGVVIVFKTLFYGVDVPGFATLTTVLLFFNGLIMINLGLLGEYVTRIFTEVKQRPLYLVRDRINFDNTDDDDHAPPVD